MRNQGITISQKEHSKFPVNDAKEMETQELPDKGFKIIVNMLWEL